MIADILLLLVLILINGLFAMSEIAIVSSRRARLVQMAETSAGARDALSLASEPTRFLSSVQVGITSIGILNGAIGEASIASRLRGSLETPHLHRIPAGHREPERPQEPTRSDDAVHLAVLAAELDLDDVLPA